MNDVLIIGYGVVGSNLYRDIKGLGVDIYDKFKTAVNTKCKDHYKFAFICVDTPMTETSLCNITEVENAIRENEADIYIIKSAVLPGTGEYLSNLFTDAEIVISPEYYGGTQHANSKEYNFTILGGNRWNTTKVVQLLQGIYDAYHTFKMTDYRSAELVKYMENSYLAMKVSFAVQFYEIAEQNEVDYEELRELFLMDPRVDPSHTFVYRDKPYWDSHCFNKDVKAIAETYDAKFLKSMIEYNELKKNE